MVSRERRPVREETLSDVEAALSSSWSQRQSKKGDTTEMAKEQEKKLATSALTKLETLEDTIRERAYELYVERGKEDGHHLDDWLKAEEEVTARKHRCP